MKFLKILSLLSPTKAKLNSPSPLLFAGIENYGITDDIFSASVAFSKIQDLKLGIDWYLKHFHPLLKICCTGG